MEALGGLLSFCYKEEANRRKEELEKRLFPLWLANYAVAKLSGNEVMDYEEFINSAFDTPQKPAEIKNTKRTAEDIMAELMPLVEADKQRGGN